MVERTMVAPPLKVAGAEFVGSKECAQCHAEVSHNFAGATHAKLMTEGANAKGIGCESCHGPGSKHVQSGGSKETIVNPQKSPLVCFQCHSDKRGEFALVHSHPVMSGKVTCTDCHEPHKGNAVQGGGTQLATSTESCLKCHPAQRGPFAFEHEVIREGCLVCHAPHGTTNPKMLKTRNAQVCLQCHTQQQTSAGTIFIGGRDHGPLGSNFLSRGTCWSAGCHEAVHGSHVSSSLRF
jgi:predicted CXXCH cytochrome family protein